MVNIMIKASEYLENENKGKIILFQRLHCNSPNKIILRGILNISSLILKINKH